MKQLKFILFWQPKKDLLRFFYSIRHGTAALLVLNYLIWPFLFYVSYLLIKNNYNTFWQILIATVLSELIERLIKSKIFWKRPLFVRHDPLPHGLIKKWYTTGSFPSGHTTKAIFFFCFILQYSVFPLPLYLLVILPLLLFRVLVGFHYPIDMIGGATTGLLVWLFSAKIFMPPYLTDMIKHLFNFFFFIH